MAALVRHPFPGNVRELENILERALALSAGGQIEVSDLGLAPALAPASAPAARASLRERLEEAERRMILDALERAGRDRDAAAAMLGTSVRGLRLRLARLGIPD